METKTIETQRRGFAHIASPDGQYNIWIPRPTPTGILVLTCGFALSGRMDFVDAIDRLPYIRVDRAQTVDNDLSHLHLTCLQAPGGCMEQLLTDLPELMEQHLGN